jgi:M6 family metalloprotease-like protein
MFVSACSGGATDTAAPEAPATTKAIPTTTQPPTTTAQATTTAAPTTTAQATTTAAPTTTAQATTTAAPTTTAQATTTTLEIPGNPGNYLGCMQFSSTASAQDWFDWYYPYYGDVAGLDRNGDGIACDPGDDWDPDEPTQTKTAGALDGVVAGCGWFESQQQAQEWFEANRDFGEGVDSNGDGIACSEGLDECCPEAWGGWEESATSTATAGVLDGVVAGCNSFESQQQAQEWFEANQDFGEGVDTNGDGTACGDGDNGGVTDCARKSQYFEPVLPQFCPPENSPPEPITVAIVDGKAVTLTTYPLPTGQPVGLEMLTAPAESDEDLCRIPQLPGSHSVTPGVTSVGEGFTAFPVIFDNLQPDQNVRVATIPIDWDDHEGDPANLPAKHEHVQIFMDYYETASQGAVTFTPTFADRWYRLPESVSDYPQRQVSDFNPKLAQHGINAADDDLDFSQIDIVVFIFPIAAPIIAGVPPSPLEFATLQHFNMTGPGDERWISSDEGWVRNYMGGGMHWEHPLRPIWSYYLHESAHMFAMPDWYMKEANATLGSQQVIDVDYAIGPLNTWGVMSTQDGPSRTFVAWTRWLLGWLDDDQVDCYTIEQVQQHGSFDTELVPLDIYEPGTKAIIIRTGEYSGFLIESRRPVFPDHDISNWEIVGRDPYGLIVYEIDATKPGAMGTLSAVTPDGHDLKYLRRTGRQQPNQVDALFNVGNTATVQGVKIELLFTGDRDWVRISK